MPLTLAEVVPTRLFHDGPFRWRVASRAVAADQWLQFDASTLDDDLAEKRRILAAPLDAFVTTPGSEAACAEVHDLVAVACGGQRLDPDVHPLLAAALRIHEDLVVMEKRDGAWTMTAGVVCFPTRWSPAEKVGKPMAAIHEPVPRYDEIGEAVERLFDRLQPGRIAWRPNWSVVGESALRLDVGDRQAPAGMPTDPDHELHLRVERQTIRRLEHTPDALVFTIRIHRWPLHEVLEQIGAELAGELRLLPDDVAAYKNLDDWRLDLAAHLDAQG
ncbi:MAG: DUF3445 domain-containing protein [Actinomycetota bacterium]